MTKQKKTNAGDTFLQVGRFLFRMVLKACGFVLWAFFKLIGGLASAITHLLEHYLDI